MPVPAGGSDLCFEWPGPIQEAVAHLRAHQVPVEVGPVPRVGAKGTGTRFSEVVHSDEWKRSVRDEEASGRSAVIEELVARMRRAEDKSEIEALRIGMELELKAIDFFKDCATSGDDPTAREIFVRIADEERFHYDLLQAQYDSVTGSGFWLDSSEFRMDGKY